MDAPAFVLTYQFLEAKVRNFDFQRFVLVSGAVVALVLAGCGNSNNDPQASTASSSANQEAVPPQSTPSEPTKALDHPNPCDFLSVDELEELLGEPFELYGGDAPEPILDTNLQTRMCSYVGQSTNLLFHFISYVYYNEDIEDTWAAIAESVKFHGVSTEVDDVGDGAFVNGEVITFRVGDGLWDMAASGHEDALPDAELMKKIARHAISNM